MKTITQKEGEKHSLAMPSDCLHRKIGCHLFWGQRVRDWVDRSPAVQTAERTAMQLRLAPSTNVVFWEKVRTETYAEEQKPSSELAFVQRQNTSTVEVRDSMLLHFSHCVSQNPTCILSTSLFHTVV